MAASTLTSRPAPTARLDAAGGPGARRLRPPSWRNPGLVVGLLLVLASTVGVALLVRAADDTVPVYAARHTLTPGQRLTADDVSVTRVRVPQIQRYLHASDAELGAQVVLRVVPEGELVPVSALGEARDADLRPVTVPVDEQSAAGLAPGALVDVWVAGRSTSRSDGFERPRQVAAAVQVSGRSTARGSWGAGSPASVQLLLSPDLVPVVIEAVDNAARVTLVPVPASLGQRR
jgi:hypothetical protein